MYKHLSDAKLTTEYRDLVDRVLNLQQEINDKADALNALMLMHEDKESFHNESVQREVDRLDEKVKQLRAIHYTMAAMLTAARDELRRRDISLLDAFLAE